MLDAHTQAYQIFADPYLLQSLLAQSVMFPFVSGGIVTDGAPHDNLRYHKGTFVVWVDTPHELNPLHKNHS